MRRSQLRMEAREAFAAKDWKKAQKLLDEYTRQDLDSEEDLVRLALVYRHFGNTEEEMHCWYRASVLNPLKPEYWDTYTMCAMNARNFSHLYSSLNRKIHLEVELSSREKMLFLICAVMTDRFKDVEEFYEILVEETPEVFQQDDFGRLADFLITFKKNLPEERSIYFGDGFLSENPIVQLESILFYLVHLKFSVNDADACDEIETMLKQAVDMNRFAVTPLLASFYFSRLKFDAVIEIAEPYLEDIENTMLSILYAESCVYSAHPEKLISLAEHFRTLGPKYRTQVIYFEALYDFSQGGENNISLLIHMQEVGNAAQTDLAHLINLQVALNNDNEEKIYSSLYSLMKNPPFYDLQERARSAVRHYLWNKIEKDPKLAEDSLMARLAQLISTPEKKDPFLLRLIISDQYRRNVLNRQTVQESIAAFPYDPYLLEIAAEFELFNGNPKQTLEYTERFYSLKEEKPSTAFDFLHLTAMELTGKIDEAAKEYTALVNNTEMDRGVLYRYFKFCIKYKRQAELERMTERLNASTVPDLKALAPFFQAEELLLQGKKEEALSMLETAKTDHVDFALHAANRFSSYDLLDQALSRYFALLDIFPEKQLILANIAEVFFAREMKTEALSYARQAWEMNQDDGVARFVYAKMLAANERYQDAQRILKMPYRRVELQDEVKDLWTDIMLHCVREDLANSHFARALERANHYLLFFPDDPTFQDLKASAEQELGIVPEPQNPGQ